MLWLPPTIMAGGGAVTRTYIGYTSAGVQGSPYSASSVNIGAASASRYVVVAVCASNDALATGSVTVAGTSCTRVAAITGSGRPCALFITNSPITTGTTATVVITVGATADIDFAIYTLSGAASPTSPTTATDNSAPLSQSVTIPAGGVAIGVANLFTSSTWTGLTKDADGTSSNFKGTVASLTTAGSVTATATGSGGSSALCVAVWSP